MNHLPTKPIRLGIIGAGIFMRDAHLPSLLRLGDLYQVVAICSKGGESARALAKSVPGEVAIYTDWAEVFSRADIDAVDIVLPIDLMPTVIQQALESGKHLISEKPIAANVATARQLVDKFAQTSQRFPGQQWMVAENWRYEAAFPLAKEIIDSGEIGRPLTFHWAQHVAMTSANKYFHTPWRRAGDLAGGYLLDVGVHHASALRLIFGEIESVSADVKQFSPELPPVDTLAATFRMANGVMGSYLLSFAAGAAWQPLLHIVGDKGCLRLQRGTVEVTSGGQSRSIPCAGMNGVEMELAAFGQTLTEGIAHKNSPIEALRDLIVVETLLQAAASGRRCQVEQISVAVSQ